LFLIRRFQPSDFERVIAIEKEAFDEYNPILPFPLVVRLTKTIKNMYLRFALYT